MTSDPEAGAAWAVVDLSRVADMLQQVMDRSGQPHVPPRYSATLRNLVTLLREDPRLAGMVVYDAFSGRYLKDRAPPWGGDPGEWSDVDDVMLRLWIAEEWAINMPKAEILDGVTAAAESLRRHEVREFLGRIQWDEKPRLRYWLQAYLGAEAEPGSPVAAYLERMGPKWLISAVARILSPGCKADGVLILEGPQGAYKSTSLRVLAGSRWFSDAPFRLGDREGSMILRGKWIVELAELDSFTRAESSAAKLFFSQSEDRYRAPWGKRPVDVPRQQVFAGTVNHSQYLKDETGNRRYWPMACSGKIDLDELRADRDQLWAEAVVEYRRGTPWWVTTEPCGVVVDGIEWTEADLFRAEQEKRMTDDAWGDIISRWMEQGFLRSCTIEEVMRDALKIEQGKWTRAEQIRVGIVLSRLGLVRRRSSAGASGHRPWIYVRPEAAHDLGADPSAGMH